MATEYIYQSILVKNEHGEVDNAKFFEGPLPHIGQAVEMVYVGNTHDGGMKFQLRVKPGV